MTAVAESTAFSASASRALGERLADLPRVAELRAAGAAAAATLAWPDSYQHRPWKYLDVSRLDLAPYNPAVAAIGAAASDLRSCPVTGEHAAALLLENGETRFTEPAPEGLVVAPFDQLEDERMRRIVAETYGTLVPVDGNRFTALHYAFVRGAVLVYVAPNVHVDLPVRIVRSFPDGGQFAAPHTLIVAGENSRVTVIEEYRSGDGEILAVPAVEVAPGPGASVRHTVVHRWGTATRVFSEQHARTERDSAFTGLQLVAGGRVVKGHLTSTMAGRGSSSELFGLALGTGQQHVDFYTLQDHVGPDTRSDLLFKDALKDRSRAVYYGVTRVGLEARRSDANQENRNLLLSPYARADSDPVLEILTSDVLRCSHGATAGPVDDEQLFYLEARGIPRPNAEALLVRAFLGQVLDRVPDEALRDELAAVLDQQLEAQ